MTVTVLNTDGQAESVKSTGSSSPVWMKRTPAAFLSKTNKLAGLHRSAHFFFFYLIQRITADEWAGKYNFQP